MTLDARISVSRGHFTLDVDLSFDEGEVVAIVGPNGSGKSTLVQTIAGLLAVDSGQITLDGRLLDDAANETFVEPEARSIGVVFQSGLLFDTMSVRDNIAFGPRAHGLSKSESVSAIMPIVERLALADLLDRRPRQLSGGQAQRVAIARAIVSQPRVLLLDEPMSGLDTESRQQVRDDFRHELAVFSGYRLLVSHDTTDIESVADRVIVLDAGRVTWDGPVSRPEWRSR